MKSTATYTLQDAQKSWEILESSLDAIYAR
jgi:hypothetical protein